MANKTFKIYGKEFTGKVSGNKFVSYSYVNSETGEWFKVKFTKECDNKPSKIGYYIIETTSENVSVQKAPVLENGKTGNRIIWIHALNKCTKDTASDEENAKKKAEMIDAL